MSRLTQKGKTKGPPWSLLMILVSGLAIVSLACGGSIAGNLPGAAPQLEDSYAASTLWPGQNWKIYVKGSDPDGDMQYIWVLVSQLGGNMWSNHLVRLKGEERHAFSGYMELPTPQYMPRGGWETVRVEVRIRDRAGHQSQVRTHEVQIGTRTHTALPEAWNEVAHNRLGTIFFEFDSDTDGSDAFKR